MRPDDCSVDEETLGEIRQHVDRALRDAGAVGVFPTPVDRIVAAANLSVDSSVSLDEGFFAKLYSTGKQAIRKAVSKVLGLLDVGARRIYLDFTVPKPKRAFVTLHETGHNTLPWQRETYAFLEDCEETLDLDLKEQFEREANVFASEVLFQGDRFRLEGEGRPFSIKTPIELAKLFGASLYASLRKYVSTNIHPCVLLVYEAPVFLVGKGYGAALRRAIPSPAFREAFGDVDWPDRCTKTTFLSPLLFPKWKIRESMKCSIELAGQPLAARVDAFNNGQYGYYVLLFPESVRPPRARGRRMQVHSH
jgi:hypothetical protein